MLKSFTARNFRNLDIKSAKFYPGIVTILGNNGQGKTNLIEAMHLLSYGKPFRTNKDQAINWNKEKAYVAGETDKNNIELILGREIDTKILLDGKKKKTSVLLGKFVSVLFHPEEIEIVGGAPTLRRAWLDKLISTVDKNYLFNLISYHKSLKNKNILLKTFPKQTSQITIWNKNLSKFGTAVWLTRKNVVDELNKALPKMATRFMGKSLYIEYENPYQGTVTKKAEEHYFNKLESDASLEERFHATIFGPHRDDFNIIVEEIKQTSITQKLLSQYGSRAEQRQAVFLLKMAEAKIFNEFYKETPTLLLDDIASELDQKNRETLFTNLSAKQIFVTTTSIDLIPSQIRKRSQVFKMENGKLDVS